jgi:hypothetical protein
MSEGPFSQLPVEILRGILGWVVGCIQLHVHPRHCPGTESYNPWDLALVCRDWRDAVFSTPCIWSDISLNIVPDPQTGYNYNALLSALKLCLNRSRNHPLVVEFVTNGKGEQLNLIPVALKLLMEHAQRWETVAISGPLDILSPYLSNYPIRYTRLRRLYLYDNNDFGPKDYVGLFCDAPLLSYISLDSLPDINQPLSGVGIPWSQISHLQINGESGMLDDLIDILKYTPNLVFLDYFKMYNHYGEEELPLLELPHLQQLNWASYDDDCWDDADGAATSQFFGLLKAPQLSVLEVDGACGDKEVEAIRGCFQRSGCSITSLRFPISRLSSLFSLIPDVRTLMIMNTSDVVLDDDDIKCNDFGDGGFEFAHLQKMEVMRYGTDDLATLQFFELFRAPQLSVLEVHSICRDSELEAIASCLRRSRCSIKSLKLASPHLLSLLSLTLDVEALVLPSPAEEYLIFLLEELTLDHSAASWLFPKLKKIMLQFDIAAGPQFNAFIKMLKSRLWTPPNSLVRLQCNKLRELELGFLVSKHMGDLIQKELTPHESLIITYGEPCRPPGRWDFCE